MGKSKSWRNWKNCAALLEPESVSTSNDNNNIRIDQHNRPDYGSFDVCMGHFGSSIEPKQRPMQTPEESSSIRRSDSFNQATNGRKNIFNDDNKRQQYCTIY
jgi:hypothetical protein